MGKKKKYDFSHLSIQQAAKGINLCLQNAKRLVESGKLLNDNGFNEFLTVLSCNRSNSETSLLVIVRHRAPIRIAKRCV